MEELLCVCHLDPPPDVWGQFFDGVSGEQGSCQPPEPTAPPQLSWELLIGQLHADGQLTSAYRRTGTAASHKRCQGSGLDHGDVMLNLPSDGWAMTRCLTFLLQLKWKATFHSADVSPSEMEGDNWWHINGPVLISVAPIILKISCCLIRLD